LIRFEYLGEFMETATMGRVMCEALVQNIEDLYALKKGTLPSGKNPREMSIQALVDTAATLISLPTAMILQLGLEKIGDKKVVTSAGIKNGSLYEAVRITIEGRTCAMDVMEVPDTVPPLVGYTVLEQLDFVVDPKAQKLIGNPAHGGEHMYDLL